MHSENDVPPLLVAPPLLPRKKRAPTLYAIVAFKFLKGAFLFLGALFFFSLTEPDSLREFTRLLQDANLATPGGIFAEANTWLQTIGPGMIKLTALGTAFYGVFSFVEGAGLFLRASWAGWAAIGESAVFVPVEFVQFLRGFSLLVGIVLILNVAVVWYLYANRKRLFHHR